MIADRAKELGCTCEWVGHGAIIVFDRECPILHFHYGYKGHSPAQLRLFDSPMTFKHV